MNLICNCTISNWNLFVIDDAQNRCSRPSVRAGRRRVQPYLHICYERLIHKILIVNLHAALDFYMPVLSSTEPNVDWFYFYSIIKAFNLGQQFYTQNDQNAISPRWSNRIGNLFEIDMGGAHCRVAPMQPRKRCPRDRKRPNSYVARYRIRDLMALFYSLH